MLQVESKLKVIDNSGILKVKIIGTYNKKHVKLGHLVLTCIKNKRRGKVFLSKYLGIIAGLRCYSYRKSGIYFKFDKNNIIILKDLENLLGTKFLGPISEELFSYNKVKQTLASWYI